MITYSMKLILTSEQNFLKILLENFNIRVLQLGNNTTMM
jgi:hypothetical protein